MIDIDASQLPRIMQCGASASMPVSPVGMEAPTDDRAQGIAAHWLAMERLTGKLADVNEMIDRKAPNGFYISPEMAEHVETYVQTVLRTDGQKFIETPMTLAGNGVNIRCRPDAITYHKLGQVVIDEFKYGWSIVEPTNWTMFAYAMAFCSTRTFYENIMFTFRIHQPRPYHPNGPVRTFRIMYTDLMAAQRDMMLALVANVSTLQTGDECKHCPSLVNCRSARKAAMNAIDVSENKFIDNLTPVAIASMLDEIEIAKKRLDNYHNALQEAAYAKLKAGEQVPNYKLEPTTGNLEWLSWVSVDMLKAAFPGKPLVKEKPITPTQAKVILGEDAVKGMSDKPNKGLKLVRYDAQKEAQRMFGKKD